jgi:glycosyltransferase involved in cell wall biosynthesis
VVVDSGSTDRTREIAAKYADTVIVQPFLGYVGQSNFAVTKASHDWILSLDCDERLSPVLREELLREKEQLGRSVGYEMPRRTYYVDRFLDHCWYPDRRIRLFDRRHGQWVGPEPHSSVLISAGQVVRLRGDILHYSFDSVSDHLDTIDRFTETAARGMYAEGRRASVFTPLLRGGAAFFKTYLLKRGFLDGFGGLVASVLSAAGVFTKYAKLRYLVRSAGLAADR